MIIVLEKHPLFLFVGKMVITVFNKQFNLHSVI